MFQHDDLCVDEHGNLVQLKIGLDSTLLGLDSTRLVFHKDDPLLLDTWPPALTLLTLVPRPGHLAFTLGLHTWPLTLGLDTIELAAPLDTIELAAPPDSVEPPAPLDTGGTLAQLPFLYLLTTLLVPFDKGTSSLLVYFIPQ